MAGRPEKTNSCSAPLCNALWCSFRMAGSAASIEPQAAAAHSPHASTCMPPTEPLLWPCTACPAGRHLWARRPTLMLLAVAAGNTLPASGVRIALCGAVKQHSTKILTCHATPFRGALPGSASVLIAAAGKSLANYLQTAGTSRAHLHRHHLHSRHAGPALGPLRPLVIDHLLRQQLVVLLLPRRLQKSVRFYKLTIQSQRTRACERVQSRAMQTHFQHAQNSQALRLLYTAGLIQDSENAQERTSLSFSLSTMRDSHLTWRAPT